MHVTHFNFPPLSLSASPSQAECRGRFEEVRNAGVPEKPTYDPRAIKIRAMNPE